MPRLRPIPAALLQDLSEQLWSQQHRGLLAVVRRASTCASCSVPPSVVSCSTNSISLRLHSAASVPSRRRALTASAADRAQFVAIAPGLDIDRVPLRTAVRLVAIMLSLGMFQGCGGGAHNQPPPPGPHIAAFAAVEADHFVGEPAELLAVFTGSPGRLDPGGIAVTSGQPVHTPPSPQARHSGCPSAPDRQPSPAIWRSMSATAIDCAPLRCRSPAPDM